MKLTMHWENSCAAGLSGSITTALLQAAARTTHTHTHVHIHSSHKHAKISDCCISALASMPSDQFLHAWLGREIRHQDLHANIQPSCSHADIKPCMKQSNVKSEKYSKASVDDSVSM